MGINDTIGDGEFLEKSSMQECQMAWVCIKGEVWSENRPWPLCFLAECRCERVQRSEGDGSSLSFITKWRCIAIIDGLGYYMNGGTLMGLAIWTISVVTDWLWVWTLCILEGVGFKRFKRSESSISPLLLLKCTSIFIQQIGVGTTHNSCDKKDDSLQL